MYDKRKKKRKKLWKRILIVTVVVAIAAGVGLGAYFGTRASAAENDLWLTQRVLPKDHALLNAIRDFAADTNTCAVITEDALVVRTENAVTSRELDAEEVAIACGRVVTLSGGTATVWSEMPYTIPSDDGIALHIAGTPNALSVLYADKIVDYRIEGSTASATGSSEHAVADPTDFFADEERYAITDAKNRNTRFFVRPRGETAWTKIYETALSVHAFCFDGDALCFLSDKKYNRVFTDGRAAQSDLPVGAVYEGGLTSAPVALSVVGSEIYVADNVNRVGCIQIYRPSEYELDYVSTFMGSADASIGRFMSPEDVAADGTSLYVADTGNNRVQIFRTNGTTLVIDRLSEPSEIETDAGGILYCLDRGNARLSVYRDGAPVGETVLPQAATDLAIRGDNVALIAMGGDVFTLRPDGSVSEKIYDRKDAVRIAACETSSEIYVLTTDTVRAWSPSGQSDLAIPATGARDLLVDADKKAYLLYDGSVSVYDADGQTLGSHTLSVPEPPKKLCRPSASGPESDSALLLPVPDAHAFYRVPSSVTGISSPRWDEYAPPVDPDGEENGTFALRTLLRDETLCRFPDVRTGLTELDKDTAVFVLSDTTTSDYFCQVAVEPARAVTLPGASSPSSFVTGYLLKSALSDPRETAPPAFAAGRVLHPVVHVYKYPSIYAKEIAVMEKDRETAMMPMPAYTDSANNRWVSVRVDENRTGYVLADGIARKHFDAAPVSLKPNATLRAETLSGIVCYQRTESVYEAIEGLFIPDDARVNVEHFDPKAEYTEIRYVAEDGLLTCYVKTSAVERDGPGVVEAIAASLIIVTLVIGLIVFALHRRNKFEPVSRQK